MSDGLGFTTDKGSQRISDLQRHGDDDLPAIIGTRIYLLIPKRRAETECDFCLKPCFAI